jgi:hypothetical protein
MQKKKAPLVGPRPDLANPSSIPLACIYNDVEAIPYRSNAEPTRETILLAEELFPKLAVAGYKIGEKISIFAKLLHAAKWADRVEGCVRYPRNIADPHCSHAMLQVVDAAVKAGLFHSVRSPKGSPSMSRLLAEKTLQERMRRDPWEFEPDASIGFVHLETRDEHRTPIPFDPTDPVPAEYQKKLALINSVNSRHEITYEPWNPKRMEYGTARRLRPVLHAVFLDDFTKCGRLYTPGKFGHVSLRKIERKTVRINGQLTDEKDISGLHPRMIYHYQGVFERIRLPSSG